MHVTQRHGGQGQGDRLDMAPPPYRERAIARQDSGEVAGRKIADPGNHCVGFCPGNVDHARHAESEPVDKRGLQGRHQWVRLGDLHLNHASIFGPGQKAGHGRDRAANCLRNLFLGFVIQVVANRNLTQKRVTPVVRRRRGQAGVRTCGEGVELDRVRSGTADPVRGVLVNVAHASAPLSWRVARRRGTL